MTAATVVVPTHDHGPTLRYSVGSALAQTITDIEVFIIGDGVPDNTREVVAELCAKDSRVRFFDHPKSARHGEPYRHEALKSARGEIVCYLADDDLWFPDHLEEMTSLLSINNFVSAYGVGVDAAGELQILAVDLATDFHRRNELGGENRIPLSCGAHTRLFYQSVQGWRTTPEGTPTDLYMWQQFLEAPHCRAASSFLPTVLYFPTPYRKDWKLEERIAELQIWEERVQDAGWRETFRKQLLVPAMAQWINCEIVLVSNRNLILGYLEDSEKARAEVTAQFQSAMESSERARAEAASQFQSAMESSEVARAENASQVQGALDRAASAEIELQGVVARLKEIEGSSTWRLRAFLLRSSILRGLARLIGRALAWRAGR